METTTKPRSMENIPAIFHMQQLENIPATSHIQQPRSDRRNSHQNPDQIVEKKWKKVSDVLIVLLCAYRNSSILSLVSDVLIVLLCSLAILGLLFRQMNISVPVDPLEWQISQDTANSIIAWLANTMGAAESVVRVAATGHDKRLFVKVVVCLYVLSILGRLVSGVTVAYAGLCLFCLYMFAESSESISSFVSRFIGRRSDAIEEEQDDL